MNTVLVLQPEDRAQLLANNVERQELLARLREFQVRLEELDQQDNEILTKTEHTEHKESMLVPDISMFKGTTRLLLKEFLNAPNYRLSHHEIREDVMGLHPDDDETDADGSALRQTIDRANRNIEKHPDFRYEIINIRGKGYQLVERGTLQNVTNRPKKRRKPTKKRYGA